MGTEISFFIIGDFLQRTFCKGTFCKGLFYGRSFCSKPLFEEAFLYGGHFGVFPGGGGGFGVVCQVIFVSIPTKFMLA